MSQQALFHESINDALREVVQHLGGTKAVGAKMRPEMPADHAGRWLNDCLNEDRRERLSPEHLMWLLKEGRAAGIHSAVAYILSECGYASPVPVDPVDERAELQRQYIEAAKMLARMGDRIERLSIKAVV